MDLSDCLVLCAHSYGSVNVHTAEQRFSTFVYPAANVQSELTSQPETRYLICRSEFVTKRKKVLTSSEKYQ